MINFKLQSILKKKLINCPNIKKNILTLQYNNVQPHKPFKPLNPLKN